MAVRLCKTPNDASQHFRLIRFARIDDDGIERERKSEKLKINSFFFSFIQLGLHMNWACSSVRRRTQNVNSMWKRNMQNKLMKEITCFHRLQLNRPILIVFSFRCDLFRYGIDSKSRLVCFFDYRLCMHSQFHCVKQTKWNENLRQLHKQREIYANAHPNGNNGNANII